jgi:hypothetical protein
MSSRAILSSIAAAVRRVAGGLLGLLPGPPDDVVAADPLLTGIGELPPDEQDARRRAWLAQIRRGRGDGNG